MVNNYGEQWFQATFPDAKNFLKKSPWNQPARAHTRGAFEHRSTVRRVHPNPCATADPLRKSREEIL